MTRTVLCVYARACTRVRERETFLPFTNICFIDILYHPKTFKLSLLNTSQFLNFILVPDEIKTDRRLTEYNSKICDLHWQQLWQLAFPRANRMQKLGKPEAKWGEFLWHMVSMLSNIVKSGLCEFLLCQISYGPEFHISISWMML